MESRAALENYYAKRAPEYERIYHKPERQGELAELHSRVRNSFIGLDVIEIACGTGYWTETLARTARSVVAVDVNEEVLAIARLKPGNASVRFEIADAYALPDLGPFSGALIAFWWSHMPKSRIRAFLHGLHQRLEPGASVMFIDNTYVAQSSTPIARADAEGNTYQLRKLEDGSLHEVLKNFPTDRELRNAVDDFGKEVEVQWLKYYWTVQCRTK